MPHKDQRSAREHIREYRIKNREQILAQGAEYRARPEVREKRQAYFQSQEARERKKELRDKPERKERDRAKNRERKLKYNYGLSAELFNAMLAEQKHACAVCGTSDWGIQGPHVDHDHATGRVRGILCFRCNIAIGYLRNDPDIATAVSEYLQRADPLPGGTE